MLFEKGHLHWIFQKRLRSQGSGPLLTCTVLVFAFVIITLSSVFAASVIINKVDILDSPEYIRITVDGSGPLPVRSGRVGSAYITVDIFGYLACSQDKRININSGGVRTITCGWFRKSPPVMRIAIATTSTRKYSVRYEDGKRRAIIEVQKINTGSSAPYSGSRVVPVSTLSTPARFVNPEVKSQSSYEVEPPTKLALLHEKPEGKVTDFTSNLSRASAMPLGPVTPHSNVDLSKASVASVEPLILVAGSEPMVISAQAATSAPKTVSLDFVASDIHDVIKALAVQSGVNVVASPDVKGDVTVSLSNVTIEEALKLITTLSGYKFANISGTYVVGTEENLKTLMATGVPVDERQTTEVVALRYTDPVAISKVIEKEMPAVRVSVIGGDKEGEPRGIASIVLSGRADDVQAAKAIVRSVEDSMASAARDTTVELYEVKYANIEALPPLLTNSIPGLQVAIGPRKSFDLKCPGAVAVEQSTGSSSTAATPVVREGQEAPPKVLILQGAKSEIDKAKSLLATLDTPQRQITIEAKVLDLTDSGAKDLGVEWGGEFGTISTFSLLENRDTATEQAGTIGRLTRSALLIDGKIKAIVASGKGKVLASPNVMALDGQPASIFIGDEIKYVTRIDRTEFGTNVTTETARVGVQLHCISTINPEGLITMNLHPEVSVITGWKELPEVRLALPEISRRFVDSTIRVKDGETIVIGGLIKEEDLHSISGIPFLKDLPIIGSIFKYDRKTRSRSEVMMFITPKLVESS